MNQPEIVIVTASPAQYAFWYSGYGIPLIGGLGVGTLCFLALMWIAGKVSRDWRGPGNLTIGIAAAVSICVGFLVFNHLFI